LGVDLPLLLKVRVEDLSRLVLLQGVLLSDLRGLLDVLVL
jgi:hypothetical protein